MKPSVRTRNITVALVSTLLIALLALQQFSVVAAPLAQINFVWNPTSATSSGQPGQVSISVTATLTNQGPTDTFNITATVPSGWPALTIAPSSSVNINANANQSFTFFYDIPATATAGTYTIDIVASRASAPSVTALFRIVVQVIAPTATTTPTPTITPTPSAICLDGFEPDNFPAQAKRIDVQIAQEHVICPTGDEDWLYFGGVEGKVYTIDVPVMKPGIDLSLELLDSNFNRVAFNDDFFNRDPANPNPVTPVRALPCAFQQTASITSGCATPPDAAGPIILT